MSKSKGIDNVDLVFITPLLAASELFAGSVPIQRFAADEAVTTNFKISPFLK